MIPGIQKRKVKVINLQGKQGQCILCIPMKVSNIGNEYMSHKNKAQNKIKI